MGAVGTRRWGRVLVIGNSIAGLLAARALADYAERVTLIDRDRIPDEPQHRAGVPQGRHIHVVLTAGQRAMEALLPPLPASTALPPERVAARGPRKRGRAGVLLGCAQRFFYPDVNDDTVRLLAAAGYDVVVPRAQECCGALHLHAGRVDEFRAMARRLMPAFDDVDVVVVNAAGCGSAMKEYGHWLPDETAGRFAARPENLLGRDAEPLEL